MTNDWGHEPTEPDIAESAGHDRPPSGQRGPRTRFTPRRLAAVATGTVIAVGAGGIAYATTTSPSPTSSSATPSESPSGSPSEAPSDETAPDVEGDRPDWGRGHHGPGFGFVPFGVGMPLHGEQVVESDEGVYEMFATQQGVVDELSDDEVTVTSEDGFTRTYALTADSLTEVAPGEAGDIAVGDDVLLVATVDGDDATVTRIIDISAWPATPDGSRGWHHDEELDTDPEATTEGSAA